VLLTLQRDSSPIDRIFAAICFGEVIIVQCLVEKGYILPDNACVVATAANQLQMLGYLHQKEGCKCSLEASLMAARSGNLDCLKYLLEAGFVGLEVCVMAAANGNLECLRWAHTHGCELSISMVLPAVENDHYDCFVYCYENGHEHTWLTGIILECIERGRTNMFMYAVDHGYPLNNISVAPSCARHKRLDMLAYAHKRGMPLPSSLLSAAATFGSLDIMKYAHEHGCAWYSAVCTNAAQAGELECLRYAVEHGCPYDHYCDAADSSNSNEVLRYAEGLPPYDGLEEVGFLTEQTLCYCKVTNSAGSSGPRAEHATRPLVVKKEMSLRALILPSWDAVGVNETYYSVTHTAARCTGQVLHGAGPK
jgi:hypothetical protein